MQINNYRFGITATTDETGSATIQIKVPGTFNGLTPGVSNGRFFSQGQIWAASAVDGDQLNNIIVQDIDGVIPNDGTRALFPNYPILGYILDPSLTYDSNIIEAVFMHPNLKTEFGPPNPTVPSFLPSGTYLCGTFTAGVVASGRILYGNILWCQIASSNLVS